MKNIGSAEGTSAEMQGEHLAPRRALYTFDGRSLSKVQRFTFDKVSYSLRLRNSLWKKDNFCGDGSSASSFCSGSGVLAGSFGCV